MKVEDIDVNSEMGEIGEILPERRRKKGIVIHAWSRGILPPMVLLTQQRRWTFLFPRPMLMFRKDF